MDQQIDNTFNHKKVTEVTNYKLSRLLERYNGDHDTAPGLPQVLWADMENATAIQYLAKQIDDLRAEIHNLKKCSYCKGTGIDPLSDNSNPIPCAQCKGKG